MKRTVLITAGTKGLGKKVLDKFLEEGYRVATTYREWNEHVAHLYKQYSSEDCIFIQGNITSSEDRERMVQETLRHFGTIHVLVNNAGPYVFERKKLVDYDMKEWMEIIEGNLTAVFHLCQLIVPEMRRNRYGRIINYGFQSADSAPGWVYRSAFAAAKVGLVSLTKTIAYEEAENGITCNMVCPGDIIGEQKEASPHESHLYNGRITPLGRSVTGGDIAHAVSFLAKEESEMITGTMIEVNGSLDVIHKYRTFGT